MLGVLLAPSAILFELDLSSDEFLVFSAPVINVFTRTACEFYEFIL